MVKITKNIVSQAIQNRMTYGGTNPKRYVMIHETANTSRGANASVHGRLQANGNSRVASWHYTCDEKQCVQSFPDNAQAWHAGNASFNRASIGIEICVNSDGDYKKATENAAKLTKSLMNDYNIKIAMVVQHNRASGKNCPMFMRAGSKGVTWSSFRKGVTSSSGNTSAGKSSGGGSNSGGSKYTPVSGKWTGQNLKIYQQGGAVKQLQKLVGVKADGYFGPSTQTAVKKAQSKHGLEQDGIAGKATYKALTGKGKKTSKKKSNMSVDGKWGTDFTKGLQRVLSSPVDGKLSGQSRNGVTRALYSNTAVFGSGGSMVIEKMQRKLGITADGLLGPETIREMQKRAGTPVDGKLSNVSPMIKWYQRRFNKGKF